MTPQAFSYATIGNNGMIYVPPYGLTDSIDYMLKINPNTYKITKIYLEVDNSNEKWMFGTVYRNYIYFLPFNESKVLVLNTDTDEVTYIPLKHNGSGKYIQSHIYGNEIISLPYGDWKEFDYAIHINLTTNTAEQIKIETDIKDKKRWHTCQMIDGIIYGMPRGSDLRNYFPYRIEYDCATRNYNLFNLSSLWEDYDSQPKSNKKYTTLAKVGNKLFAPPYSENPNFDILAKYVNGHWYYERTGIQETSRKYFTHTVARNKKIYFPPAGHDEDWAKMLVINSNTEKWYTLDLNIGKESKKYFAGVENSQGKIYYIPRGGCVCEPEETWKSQGDLTEVLVIDTKDDSYYTIDISKFFVDNTTIEKYNNCIIIDDKIFALPYGESETFQTMLVFDTLTEEVIKAIDLNEL